MNEASIDTGDTVLHGPTGQTWTVAHVDGDRLAWCGWPPGEVPLADCTLIEKATPQYRDNLLQKLAGMDSFDRRRHVAALRLLQLSLLPCPFCGGRADPAGWMGADHRIGPACDDCGGTAETIELWNTRVPVPEDTK